MLLLQPQVRLPVDTRRADDPHVKAHLLLQAHMARLPPPISDYLTDTRGVLDNSIRLAQVMVLRDSCCEGCSVTLIILCVDTT